MLWDYSVLNKISTSWSYVRETDTSVSCDKRSGQDSLDTALESNSHLGTGNRVGPSIIGLDISFCDTKQGDLLRRILERKASNTGGESKPGQFPTFVNMAAAALLAVVLIL
jgi:hypothetical protein